MKGRTLADQKKMKVGGVTKMQAGRSVPGMKDRMGRAMFRADVLGNRPTPSAPPQPMMSKGGKTYRKGGKC
jgi:PAB1-binding protein PBP1